jgi:hypothetical protein
VRKPPGGKRRWCSPIQATGGAISRYQDLSGANFSAIVNSAPLGNTVSLTSQTYSWSNFGAGTINGVTVGASVTRAGLVGTGIGNTILQMTASTSTHSADVPAQGSGLTNQLYLMYFDYDGVVLRCFQLNGTSQGHLYNGIRFHQVVGASCRNIKLLGAAPGDNNVPPGETFGWNDYLGAGNVYEQVEIDGNSTGASAFGANSYTGVTYVDCYAHHNIYSAGWALWQGTSVANLIRPHSNQNRSAFSFERVGREGIGQARGTVNLVQPTFGTFTSGGQDIFLGNDQGSTLLNIYDPVDRNSAFQNKIHIYFPTLEQGNTNIQAQSDVKVFIGGAWTGGGPGVGAYVGGTDVTSSYIDYNPFE